VLTAVDAFSKHHDEHDRPANERYYRDLLPLAQPGEGEQYAFEVDLDECTGCKSCVVACHSLNGLDDDESWRSVGLLQGSGKIAFQQTVTTACHHCVEPACLTGCPVDAYEKDPRTGIVSHLDDQCIGCGYCTLTCPYEVPRFNEERGIVRKCDMCKGRLEVGEAPACVQSCPNGAIRISIVSKASAIAAAAGGATLVPGAPSSAITVPTTIYRTSRPAPEGVRAADHHSLRPAHPHPPLAVLTQLAVGALAVELALRVTGKETVVRPVHAVVVAAVALVALSASTLHLGRPRYAFRSILGITHSWLSREVVAFGLFAVAAPADAAATWADGPPALRAVTGALALAAGVAGITCSVLLYGVTRRAFWRARRTGPLFGLSALATGTMATMATTTVIAVLDGRSAPEGIALVRALAPAVVVAVVAKLAVELAPLLRLRSADDSDLRRSALLLRRDLWPALQLRLLLAMAGGVVIPAGLALDATPAATAAAAVAAVVGLTLVVAGELVERHHFFRVAVAPRMPGELR
jgi:Fe-S-cluster-containing dehydrogenase component/DMSO reductase anchor subunit